LAANSETAVILEQLMLGIAVVAAALVLLPFLLVMAGVGAAMLLLVCSVRRSLGRTGSLDGVSRYIRARGPAVCIGHWAGCCR
jgi:hypothetical protein